MAFNNELWLYLPFTKVNEKKRTVTGIAIGDNLDSQNDVVKFDATIKAFNEWEGNIREMHMPKAVGKAINHRPVKVHDDGQEYNGMEVEVYVSKGAQDTWEKVLDKTLQGFSIGGKVNKSSKQFLKSIRKVVRKVEDYSLRELSLVDNPANPLSRITMVKQVDDNTLIYDAKESGPIFYCKDDGVAELDVSVCSECGEDMEEIGFVDNFQVEVIEKLIDTHMKGGPMDTENTEDLQKNTEGDNITDMDNENLLGKIKDMVTTASGTINVVYPPTYTSSAGNDTFAVDTTKSVDPNLSVLDTNEEQEEENKEEEVEKNEGGESEMNMEDLSRLLDEKLTAQQEAILKTVDERIEKANADVITDDNSEEEDSKEEEGNDDVEKSVDSDQTDEVDIATLLARIEELEASNGNAVRKSEDDSGDDDEDVTLEKNEAFWGNIFVDQSVIEGLGYQS